MGTGISGLEYDPLSQVTTKYSGNIIDTTVEPENTSYMDFDSYLKLLVAQMSNQDFNDPMSDSEVLNQMATYSMLEGIKTMTSQSNISYASSLVGKAVTIAENDVYDTGMIDSVIIDNGTPYIIVNGTQHDISTICDIVDPEKFKDLAALLGQTVSSTTAEGKQITGEVTNVLVIGGAEFLVIDKSILCARSTAKIVEPSSEIDENITTDETATVNTDQDTSNETTEAETISANEYEVTVEIDDNLTASSFAAAQNQTVSMTYEERADAIYTELMKSLDGISDSAILTQTDEEKSTSQDGVYSEHINASKYSAVIIGDEDAFLEALSNNTEYVPSNRSDEEISNYRSSDSTYTTPNNIVYSPENTISTSNSIPKRLYAEQFAAEAEIADSYGTRMYDIRFINNTSITSRINTDRVIGRTQTGLGVTEIGFSGVGKLGEVVTFEDGTQRVEIIHKNGYSSWINTTGNHTLDVICDINQPIYELEPELTASERSIRDYAIRDEVMKNSGVNLGILIQQYGSTISNNTSH